MKSILVHFIYKSCFFIFLFPYLTISILSVENDPDAFFDKPCRQQFAMTEAPTWKESLQDTSAAAYSYVTSYSSGIFDVVKSKAPILPTAPGLWSYFGFKPQEQIDPVEALAEADSLPMVTIKSHDFVVLEDYKQ